MSDYIYHAQHIPLKWFNRTNGLDSGQVHNITQDSDGLIWFAGPVGLSRYNGNELKNVTQKVNLSCHGLRKVVVANQGQLFVSTDQGVEQINDEIAHPIMPNQSIGLVDDLAFTAKHGLLLSSSKGLLVFNENQLKTIFPGHYSRVFVDRLNRIWTENSAEGVVVYDAEFNQILTEVTEQIQSIKHISEATDRLVCVLTKHHLLEIDQNKVIRTTPLENTSAALRQNNDLWICRNNQLFRYNLLDGQWQNPTLINSDCLINDFFVDSFENIWCATDMYGAIKISALKKLIYQPVFERQGSVFCINKLDDRHYQLAGRNIHQRVNTKNHHYYQDQPCLDDVIIWDELLIEHGPRLLATDAGIYLKQQDQWCHLFPKNNCLSRQARVLLKRGNSIWIGTRMGLSEILMDDSGHFHIVQQYEIGYVYCLAVDAQNKLWVGTLGNGLFIEHNREFIKHKLRYVSDNSNVYCIQFNALNCAALLHDNRISIHDENQDSQLIKETETAVSGWTLVWDGATVWVGGVNGLSQYDIKKKVEIRNITAFLTKANWEFTTSKSLALVNGRYLYCGLNSGFAVVDKKQLIKLDKYLNTHLDEVIWENIEAEEVKSIDTVKPGNWTLLIKFYSAWYYNSNSLKYRYKLNGFDDIWHETRQNFVQYNSLPIGRYTLLIQAFSPLKGWGESTHLYEFNVVMPLWARGWLSAIYRIYNVVYGVFSNKRKKSALIQMNADLTHQLDQKNQEIKQAFSELRETNQQLRQEANHDALTGLANRRSFQNTLNSSLEMSARSNSPIALLLIDIDDFKFINDNHGHDVGDLVLIKLANILESMLRIGDHASRFGGEEFAVILPHTSLDGAKIIATKILHQVSDYNIQKITPSLQGSMTVSVGIAVFAGENWQQADSQLLIKQADKGLYQAKQNGKNQYGILKNN